MNVRSTMMMMMILMSCVFAAATMAAPARAADTRKEIEARLESRYKQVVKLQNKGLIGETWEGYVEAVDGDDALDDAGRALLKDENADRKQLYELIANDVAKGQQKLTPNEVGQQNARRKFQKAEPEDFLKVKEGRWIQLKEVKQLRKDGTIGETWEGYVAIVDSGESDAQVEAVVAEENRLRKDSYDRRAKKENASAKKIAKEAGEKNIKQLAEGEFYKPEGGEWKKK